MQILKRYKGETEWREISMEEAREQLSRSFTSVDAMLNEIAIGFTVYTAFAEFKREDGSESVADRVTGYCPENEPDHSGDPRYARRGRAKLFKS